MTSGIEVASEPAVPVEGDLLEKATMLLLGHVKNEAPHVDWFCNRQWRVSDVRKRMALVIDMVSPPSAPSPPRRSRRWWMR